MASYGLSSSRKGLSYRTATQRTNYNEDDEDADEIGIEYSIKDAALHILAMEHQKSITKNADLKKLIGISYESEWKRFFLNLKEEFERSLGMTLVTAEAKTFPISLKKATPTCYSSLVETGDEAKHGFLTLLLTLLFMFENNLGGEPQPLTEDQLYEQLAIFGIGKHGDEQAIGDVSKLIGRPGGEFIRQGWIQCRKEKLAEKEIHYYEWGIRARASVNAMDLLKWHCQVEGTKPEDYQAHYKAAKVYVKAMKTLRKEEE